MAQAKFDHWGLTCHRDFYFSSDEVEIASPGSNQLRRDNALLVFMGEILLSLDG